MQASGVVGVVLGMRAFALGVVVLTGCYRPGVAPDHPIPPDPVPDSTDPTEPVVVHRETAPTALIAVAPERKPGGAHDLPYQTIIEHKKLWVGGCNTACVDCWLGNYQTYVVGELTRTGEKLFPVTPLAPGYQCGAEVAIGERVTLRAHSPTEHMTIVSWTPFFDRDACPCEGSSAQTCTFVVTPEIASHSDRIYCGAAWKQKASAQIGH
jgi:hypothetical protein